MDSNRDAVFRDQKEDGIRFLPDEPGVYCILNRVNGKWYVGRTSKSILVRCRKHRNELRSGVGYSWAMLRDAKTHGVEAFFFMAPQLLVKQEVSDIEAHFDKVEVWLARQLNAHDERYGYNSEAGHHRSRAARFRDRERKLLKSGRGNYQLLPGVDLHDPINPELLASWVPGG